jgi:peptidoglycan/LPS O-acetylase OafA/YrhL
VLPETLAPAERVATPPAPGRPPRLTLLDGLRFLAALAVVSYHFTAIKTPVWGLPTTEAFPALHQVTRYGYLGVDLFFFISGFVILMTAWGRELPAFVGSRVARLFPGYWAGVLLTGGLLLVVPNVSGKDVTIPQVLTNLTMLHEPNGVSHVDGVYWTLWVEMRFYLLVGLLMLVGLTRQRVIAFATIWPVAAALAATTEQAFLRELLIASWAPYFAAGMLLYLVHREGWSPLLGGLVGLQVVLAMTRAADYAHIIDRKAGGEAKSLAAMAVVLLCFAAVALVTTTRLQHFRWGLATTLGLLTYPLYLVHEYWGLFLISHLAGSLPRYAVLLVAVLFVLGLAWLVNRVVERPLAPVVRRWVTQGLRAPVERTAVPAPRTTT